MIVNRKNTKSCFKPIELTIILETEKEYNVFREGLMLIGDGCMDIGRDFEAMCADIFSEVY